MARQVRCTEKEMSREIHARIKAIGGTKQDGTYWIKTQEAAIQEIEAGDQTYYVNIEGLTPNLVVAMHEGVKYLKTYLDSEAPTSLLGLPDCPSMTEGA